MENKIDKKIDFILCLFLGYLGVHKFYEKKIFLGIIYLFTGGVFFIGWIYDCIKLGKFLNKSKNTTIANYNVNNINKTSNTEIEILQDDTYSDSLTFKVAGVTYSNPDGSSRQEYIENLDEDEILELQPYDYKGNTAIYVLDSEGHILGNIPKSKVEKIMDLIETSGIDNITINEKGNFVNEKEEETYYLKININLI